MKRLARFAVVSISMCEVAKLSAGTAAPFRKVRSQHMCSGTRAALSMCFSLRSLSTSSHRSRGICGDMLFDNADIVGAGSQEPHREPGKWRRVQRVFHAKGNPKQLSREYVCPHVAGSEQGEEGQHDMTSTR